MTAPMIGRRDFIAAIAFAAAASGIAPPLLAQTNNDDWINFDRLASAFNALLNAPNPIADTITRLRFVDFLRRVKQPTDRILAAKSDVFEMLQHPSCSPTPNHPASTSRMAAADQAARRIVPLVDQLAAHLDTLRGAIRPAGVGADIGDIADGLRSMHYRKMWINRIPGYCHLSPQRRTEFRREVAVSRNRVGLVAIRLDSLIDRLN